jgi:hypothetical protein
MDENTRLPGRRARRWPVSGLTQLSVSPSQVEQTQWLGHTLPLASFEPSWLALTVAGAAQVRCFAYGKHSLLIPVELQRAERSCEHQQRQV